jgi:hypothetical protein
LALVFFYQYRLAKAAGKDKEFFMKKLRKALAQQVEGSENARLD